MGGRSSKEGSWRQASSIRSTSSSSSTWGGEYQPPYGQESQTYAPPQQSHSSQLSYPPSQDYVPQYYGGGAEAFDHRKTLDRRYSRIADNYNSLEQVLSQSLGKHIVDRLLHFIFIHQSIFCSAFVIYPPKQYCLVLLKLILWVFLRLFQFAQCADLVYCLS